MCIYTNVVTSRHVLVDMMWYDMAHRHRIYFRIVAYTFRMRTHTCMHRAMMWHDVMRHGMTHAMLGHAMLGYARLCQAMLGYARLG